EDVPPRIDFSALDQAAARLTASAKAYDAAVAGAGTLSPAARAALNCALQKVDGALIDDDGLPGRPWFRNLA
ncbi:transferrin receptor-like dimerization domain-containing protein, partial [Vibrio parahaemolyticus]